MSTLAVLLFALLPPAADVPAEKELFVDSFQGKLSDGWTWLREDNGGWRVGEGKLEIRSRPGVVNEARTIAQRSVPAGGEGALAVEVYVTNEPTEQWEQLGLAWYYDDRHLVKLVKERVDGETWLVMGKAHPTKGALVAKVPLKTADVLLRLVVRGESIYGQAKPGGKGDWQDLGSCELPSKDTPKISLLTFHGPADVEHWARFEKFRVLGLTK